MPSTRRSSPASSRGKGSRSTCPRHDASPPSVEDEAPMSVISLTAIEPLARPAIDMVTEYLERRSYFGVFFLLFLGAFGPSPPEEIVLLIAGFLVFQGVARFPLMVGAELGGIVVADSILYGFGAF